MSIHHAPYTPTLPVTAVITGFDHIQTSYTPLQEDLFRKGISNNYPPFTHFNRLSPHAFSSSCRILRECPCFCVPLSGRLCFCYAPDSRYKGGRPPLPPSLSTSRKTATLESLCLNQVKSLKTVSRGGDRLFMLIRLRSFA